MNKLAYNRALVKQAALPFSKQWREDAKKLDEDWAQDRPLTPEEVERRKQFAGETLGIGGLISGGIGGASQAYYNYKNPKAALLGALIGAGAGGALNYYGGKWIAGLGIKKRDKKYRDSDE